MLFQLDLIQNKRCPTYCYNVLTFMLQLRLALKWMKYYTSLCLKRVSYKVLTLLLSKHLCPQYCLYSMILWLKSHYTGHSLLLYTLLSCLKAFPSLKCYLATKTNLYSVFIFPKLLSILFWPLILKQGILQLNLIKTFQLYSNYYCDYKYIRGEIQIWKGGGCCCSFSQ